jgi:hypothetical protein
VGWHYVCDLWILTCFLFILGIIQDVQKVTQPMEKCNINFIFFVIMPIYYNKCWKCPPLRSSQRCTRRIMLANTFCNVSVYILSTVRWMLAWSSCGVCVDGLNTQYPWDVRIKISLGGLSMGILEATISLIWGVQQTQIPSKPWVAWLFEHPVYDCGGPRWNVIDRWKPNNSENDRSECHFVHKKSHIELPLSERGYPRWEAGH